MASYRTGTVAVTNGSKIVTGTGTTFNVSGIYDLPAAPLFRLPRTGRLLFVSRLLIFRFRSCILSVTV